MKLGGLKSSGQRLMSSIGKTKRIAFFILFFMVEALERFEVGGKIAVFRLQPFFLFFGKTNVFENVLVFKPKPAGCTWIWT